MMAQTKAAFIHLPTKDEHFHTVLTPYRGNSYPSTINHLIDKVKDPEFALFSLGRYNLCTIYPKFDDKDKGASFQSVLSVQGIECYNEIIQALKQHREEGCLQDCEPFFTEDCSDSYCNISFKTNCGGKSSPMIFLETNTDNLKDDRPDIVGWCVSASGKLRLMDQLTTDRVRTFLKEKCRDTLGSLSEIDHFRFKANQNYRKTLIKLGISFNNKDEDINDKQDIY